jgi:hypothetical protein
MNNFRYSLNPVNKCHEINYVIVTNMAPVVKTGHTREESYPFWNITSVVIRNRPTAAAGSTAVMQRSREGMCVAG